MSRYTGVAIDGSNQVLKGIGLEILGDAGVPLMGENTWVLDSCVSSSGHISYNGLRLLLLLGAIGVTSTVRIGLVVILVAIVIMLLRTRHARILARIVRVIGNRV